MVSVDFNGTLQCWRYFTLKVSVDMMPLSLGQKFWLVTKFTFDNDKWVEPDRFQCNTCVRDQDLEAMNLDKRWLNAHFEFESS
jgi:hypothetical protein